MHTHLHEHSCQQEHQKNKKLIWVTILNLSISLIQIIGGLLSNSLSLLSDSLHNLGDSTAIVIAFIANKRSKKQPNAKNTFGYKRIEILAALFNSISLIAICIYVVIEAIKHFIYPEPIHGKVMMIVAFLGLLANLLSVFILHRDKQNNLNVRALYLHLLGDTLSSIAVIAGGYAIWVYNIIWIDPLITLLIGIYIIYHTWHIISETISILMQSTPKTIDVSKIKKTVEQNIEVDNIHHLHIWQLDDNQIHMEAHINLIEDILLSKAKPIREKITNQMKILYNINHVTLQIDYQCCNKKELIIKQINQHLKK